MNTPGYDTKICIHKSANYFYYYTGKNHYVNTDCNWKYLEKWKIIDARVARMFLQNDQAYLWDGKSQPTPARKLVLIKGTYR